MQEFFRACETLQQAPNQQAARIWNEAIHYCVGALCGKINETGILPTQAVNELFQLLIKNETLKTME